MLLLFVPHEKQYCQVYHYICALQCNELTQPGNRKARVSPSDTMHTEASASAHRAVWKDLLSYLHSTETAKIIRESEFLGSVTDLVDVTDGGE